MVLAVNMPVKVWLVLLIFCKEYVLVWFLKILHLSFVGDFFFGESTQVIFRNNIIEFLFTERAEICVVGAPLPNTLIAIYMVTRINLSKTVAFNIFHTNHANIFL